MMFRKQGVRGRGCTSVSGAALGGDVDDSAAMRWPKRVGQRRLLTSLSSSRKTPVRPAPRDLRLDIYGFADFTFAKPLWDKEGFWSSSFNPNPSLGSVT